MTKLYRTEILSALCKATGRCGMLLEPFIPNMKNPLEEIIKAAPYLSMDDMQIIFDEHGIILFDNRAEMDATFELTVGDDGPTDTNPYDGPARVWALTCDESGQLLSENT